MLGLLEQYMTPTLDAAQLCSARAGSDLGRESDRFEELFIWLPLEFPPVRTVNTVICLHTWPSHTM